MPAARAGEGAALRALIEHRLDPPGQPLDAALSAFVAEIRQRYGDSLQGVLLYGSYLRGKRDSPPDFYILVEHYSALPRWQAVAAALLPPNVYHLQVAVGAQRLHTKCAIVSLKRFEAAVGGDFHSYFWARFAQPSRLLYARDGQATERIIDAVAQAVRSFVSRAAPLLPARFSARELWIAGLAMTYRCELRAESGDRAERLYAADPEYFEGVTAALAREDGTLSTVPGGAGYRLDCTPGARRLGRLSWWPRRLQGKLLSVARLIKAALTFAQPLDYLLWKIERHSGVKVTPSARQRRYPLIFAWPLLWRVYRRGGFR